MNDLIHLHPDDNILIAARDIAANEKIQFESDELVVKDSVHIGHKVACRRISSGGSVRKYGQVIGCATSDVEPGNWVHSHNLSNGRD